LEYLIYCDESDKNGQLYSNFYGGALVRSIDYNYNLQFTQDFSDANIKIRYDDIVEATSHRHDILQCADIIIGAMWFRLNKMHLVKPEGNRFRGKRTRAKDELYQHINKRIRECHRNFNVGVNTSLRHYSDKWNYSYRHWLFVPRNF
jgi:hypothetical protein